MINFDANASYGLLPEVKSAIKKFELFQANPSSIHQLGQNARGLIEEARTNVSNLLKVGPNQRLVFTSGASESNTQAIFSSYWNDIGEKNSANIVTTAIEHPSVLEAVNHLEKLGIEKRLVYPKESGEIRISDFLDQIDNNTRLVSFMIANNETGYILPIEELVKEIRGKFPDIVIHCDAVQALGKMEVDYSSLGIDLISFSAHKIGGLSGVGALVVNKSIKVDPIIYGGPQESRYRAGTENLLGIYSFGLAAKALLGKLTNDISAMKASKNHICKELNNNFGNSIAINCQGLDILPNTISLEIKDVFSDDLVVALDLKGICISSGAACASGKPLPSHVLLAMGKSEEKAKSTVRISFRADLSDKDRDDFLSIFSETLTKFTS